MGKVVDSFDDESDVLVIEAPGDLLLHSVAYNCKHFENLTLPLSASELIGSRIGIGITLKMGKSYYSAVGAIVVSYAEREQRGLARKYYQTHPERLREES